MTSALSGWVFTFPTPPPLEAKPNAKEVCAREVLVELDRSLGEAEPEPLDHASGTVVRRRPQSYEEGGEMLGPGMGHMSSRRRPLKVDQ